MTKAHSTAHNEVDFDSRKEKSNDTNIHDVDIDSWKKKHDEVVIRSWQRRCQKKKSRKKNRKEPKWVSIHEQKNQMAQTQTTADDEADIDSTQTSIR